MVIINKLLLILINKVVCFNFASFINLYLYFNKIFITNINKCLFRAILIYILAKCYIINYRNNNNKFYNIFKKLY